MSIILSQISKGGYLLQNNWRETLIILIIEVCTGITAYPGRKSFEPLMTFSKPVQNPMSMTTPKGLYSNLLAYIYNIWAYKHIICVLEVRFIDETRVSQPLFSCDRTSENQLTLIIPVPPLSK